MNCQQGKKNKLGNVEDTVRTLETMNDHFLFEMMLAFGCHLNLIWP